jgi:hypothetical protein
MTPEQERPLIDAITAAFGTNKFDTTSIICKASHDAALAAAIEAVIPNCRYRSGYRRFRLRERAVRRVLKPLASKYFETDEQGWWHATALSLTGTYRWI